jgi:hypothetical protein
VSFISKRLSLHHSNSLVSLFVLFLSLTFVSLISRNESRLIKSPVYLSVCPPLITFEPLHRFSRNLYGGNAVQGDLDAIIFNPIASIILKLLRFKFVT